MKLLTSTTSPFARIVRVVLKESHIEYDEVFVDPWQPPPELAAASPACRVPVLIRSDGLAISDSQFIVQYLALHHGQRHWLEQPPAEQAKAALSYSLLEAFASLIIGRRSLEGFDDSPVGLRRKQSIVEGLLRLEQAPPVYSGGLPSLACVVTGVLLDALVFRFPDADWLPEVSALSNWAQALRSRPSFATTRPFSQ